MAYSKLQFVLRKFLLVHIFNILYRSCAPRGLKKKKFENKGRLVLLIYSLFDSQLSLTLNLKTLHKLFLHCRCRTPTPRHRRLLLHHRRLPRFLPGALTSSVLLWVARSLDSKTVKLGELKVFKP